MSRIAIFGAGYVGLVTGACFAELGHDVAVRDIVPDKIEALKRGKSPIFEPGLEELLERNRDRLEFTLGVGTALEGTEFIFEGTAIRDFMHPDRIVIGANDDADSESVAELYATLDTSLLRTDVASAEMVKLAANAFLTTRV